MTYSIWESPTKLVETIKNFDRSKIVKGKDEWDEITNSTCSFHGKKGTKGVIEEFYGEHSYEAKLTYDIEQEIIPCEMYKKRFSYVNRQTVGQRVDIPRYLSGDTRYWSTVKKKRLKVPAVRVYAPMGGRGYVSKEEMTVCGATSCAIVEILESSGFNVELWAACCVEDVYMADYNTGEKLHTHLCQLIKLKNCGDYTDYGMINYITGNSHFYRNIIFKDRIISALGRKDIHYCGVGGSYNFSKDAIPKEEEIDFDLDIVVPRCYSIEQAQTFINKKLSNSQEEIMAQSFGEQEEQE